MAQQPGQEAGRWGVVVAAIASITADKSEGGRCTWLPGAGAGCSLPEAVSVHAA